VLHASNGGESGCTIAFLPEALGAARMNEIAKALSWEPGGRSPSFKFNNRVPATPKSWSDTHIVVPVPTGATTGNIVVTVGGQEGQSASKSFNVQVNGAESATC
jgi:hypothetical protein